MFLPAINRAGPEGWDMVKVAADLKRAAEAAGNQVCWWRVLVEGVLVEVLVGAGVCALLWGRG